MLLQVVDAQGNPVPGAIISSQSALFSVDSSGHRLFENLSPGRFFARVDARGFTSATSVLELRAGAHVGTQVRLLPRPAPLPFQTEQGGILQTPQVRLSIPPNAVVDSLGRPVTGSVEVSIVPLDPTSQLTLAPGPLEGLTSADGEAVALESIFMADVSLWREEGSGTFQPSQTQPGRLAWAATVNHFTYWNVDRPVRKTVLSCVNVQLLDAGGNPVPDFPVSALAWDRGEATWADAMQFTGADGQACTTIKQGFSTDILAGLPDAPMASTTVTAINRGVCSTDNSKCLQVTLTIPPVICTAGANEPCAYSGPAGTEGVGRCQAGRRWCNVTGTAWSACQGEVPPSPEDCGTPFDDDCDGAVNEDPNCLCPGVGTPCYGGAPATMGVGICQGGAVGCDPFGAVSCMGQQLPQMERCWTPEDDDCDGVATACYSGEWTAVGNLTWPRSSHTATRLQDGKVLVVGGQRSPATAEVYDPATGTWSATGSLTSTRSEHAAALLPDGKILVIGGISEVAGMTETAEVYDPATGTWSATGSFAALRNGHTATLLLDGRVLAVSTSSTSVNVATAEVYTP